MSEQIFTKQRGGTFARRCKHFDGINFTEPEKRCKAGVLMQSVIVEQPYKYRQGKGGAVYTSGYSMPCFSDDDPLHVCHCEHQAFPTPTEIAEHDAEVRASFDRVVLVRNAIIADAGGKRGVAGKIPCPACKNGTVGYSIAALNGHVWARCSTEGCVAWME